LATDAAASPGCRKPCLRPLKDVVVLQLRNGSHHREEELAPVGV
jgi:hypothetical protein